MEKSTVIDFMLQLPEPNKSIALAIRNLIKNNTLTFTEQLRFNTPFFDSSGKWLCYLSFKNKKTFEDFPFDLGFVHGNLMSNEQNVLEAKNRKQVKSITLTKLEDIENLHVRELINEAILINEELAKKAKKKIIRVHSKSQIKLIIRVGFAHTHLLFFCRKKSKQKGHHENQL